MSSVSINPPKTPVTKGSSSVAAATTPNVCKMPGPPAPFVPTPLPNIGKSEESPKGYSKKVKIEGEFVGLQGASFGSHGDIASKGTGGGLVSANTHGPTKFVAPGALDVKIEGKNVQLLGDQMVNNCGPSGSPPNAATMMGAMHNSSTAEEIDVEAKCAHCGKALDHESHDKANDFIKRISDKKSQSLAHDANHQNKPLNAKKVGGMSFGGTKSFSFSGSGDGKLFNVISKKEVPLSQQQKNKLKALGHNEVGNCCEQKLLRNKFIGTSNILKPEDIGSISMGIGGSLKKGELRNGAQTKPDTPCEVCKRMLVAMLCTNDPPNGGA